MKWLYMTSSAVWGQSADSYTVIYSGSSCIEGYAAEVGPCPTDERRVWLECWQIWAI